MPQPKHLPLNDVERLTLEEMRDHHPLPYMRERATALLKVAVGQSERAVARNGLLKERWFGTVAEWVNRFEKSGLAGLVIRPGRGRKPAFFPSAPNGQRRPRGSAGRRAL